MASRQRTMTSTNPSVAMNSAHLLQAVTGCVPPQSSEAQIRDVWPSLIGSNISAVTAIARLAELLSNTIVLRPVAWLLLLPLFVKHITPFLAKHYVLTNRRLMLVRFPSQKPYREIALADIEDVRMEPNSYNTYFRAATLDVYVKGQVALKLRGVREPESFRLAILQASHSWPTVRSWPAASETPVQGAAK